MKLSLYEIMQLSIDSRPVKTAFVDALLQKAGSLFDENVDEMFSKEGEAIKFKWRWRDDPTLRLYRNYYSRLHRLNSNQNPNQNPSARQRLEKMRQTLGLPLFSFFFSNQNKINEAQE